MRVLPRWDSNPQEKGSGDADFPTDTGILIRSSPMKLSEQEFLVALR